MKQFIVLILCLAFFALLLSCGKNNDSNIPPSTVDSFAVTVNNGYGSGKYKTGDTVHIFSNNYATDQLFGQWSGDVSLLDGPAEWHTWFVMPNKNLTFTGGIENIDDFSLKFEQIQGKDRLKPVYYYFPPGHKGIVYLLHGTNGSTSVLVDGYEYQQLIKDLVHDGFGVVITEAEESTTGVDANGDGKLRWAILPMDTVQNVDYANIRAITDTLYDRGIADRSKPRYSIGMSDGGFFSEALSLIYQFKAGVLYCAQGSEGIAQATSVPVQFCMAQFDNNENVGPAGNADALSYSNALNARGVCSKYFVKPKCPVYPERFARSGEISTTLSKAIFDELKSKGYLDDRNYFIGYSDALISDYQRGPTSFPVINSLTSTQRQFMLAQINLSVSDHHIYSDYNRATLKFLDSLCQ